MSSYLITSFCWIVATTVVTWLNDFGRLCGPGGWDVATATFHTYPVLKDDIGQVLHSILIADQVTVSTGFLFHCYDGIYWFDISGVVSSDYETCCRIRDGTADAEGKAKHVWKAWNHPIPVGLRPLACRDCVLTPPEAWRSVCCQCCVLWDRSLCAGPITCPEKSYRAWCVWVWSWSLDNEEALGNWGCCLMGGIA